MTSLTELIAQLQCLQQGGPFKIAHVSKPDLAHNEVLIRQRVIAFNLVDTKQRDFGVLIRQWPYVLGIEGAGIIEAVGTDVIDLKPGEEVAAWQAPDFGAKWGGAFQDFVSVPPFFVTKKPRNITLEEAASLPICFVTAVSGIVSLDIPLPFLDGMPKSGHPPASVLILGGSSATGAAAIQLLRQAYPFLPILATCSKKHHEKLIDLGATSVLDYHSSSLVSSIKSASPGGVGVDVAFDCVSAGAHQTDICDVFDSSGSKRYAAVFTGVPVLVPKGVTKIDVNGWSMFDGRNGRKLIPLLAELVESGRYRVPLPVRVVGHGLDDIPRVLDQVKTASGEKILLTL